MRMMVGRVWPHEHTRRSSHGYGVCVCAWGGGGDFSRLLLHAMVLTRDNQCRVRVRGEFKSPRWQRFYRVGYYVLGGTLLFFHGFHGFC